MATAEELKALSIRTRLQIQKQIEDYEERAAIMEYEANMPRKQAERAAYYDWRKLHPGVVPEEIRAKLRLTNKDKNDGT